MKCPSGMVVDKTRKLSKKRLDVIIEALNARLSGEIEDAYEVEDYQEARLWAQQQREKRS